MVNAVQVAHKVKGKPGYVCPKCGKCDSLYDYKQDAKECCTPKSPFYGLPKTPLAWRV